MGIPCDEPAYVEADNQPVFVNTTIPDYTLKNKSQSIPYHIIREGAERYEWMITYVSTHENEADLVRMIVLVMYLLIEEIQLLYQQESIDS